MTKNLKIKLNQDYKSFENGFTTDLEGDLIIISGTNGSGKSQLMEIVKGDKENIPGMPQNNTSQISSDISQNGDLISKEQILYKSFKTLINIGNLTTAELSKLDYSKNQVWSNYRSYRLDKNRDYNLKSYKNSCIKAKNILIDMFGEQEFNSGRLTESQVKNSIPNDFIWKEDDIFKNTIGEIFFNYASKVYDLIIKKSKEGIVESDIDFIRELGDAPWTELNNLFENLNFSYRFKENYFIESSRINEQPKLFGLDENGEIDETQGRDLAELSDGEKAIISFTFGSLNREDENIKILLLDEYDATLNPSLIESFYEILDRYFIKKGIQVIIVTHSPTTISLAPKYAQFYEIFKKGSSSRILSVNQTDYSEMRIANKDFYKKILNSEERIKELEGKIDSQNDILIITEGKTDWKYFLKALEYFHGKKEFLEIKEEYFLKFGSQDDIDRGICGTDYCEEFSENKLNNFLKYHVQNNSEIRIGIFDSDTNIPNYKNEEKGVFSFKIEPNNISTEFLFSDSEIKSNILISGKSKRLYIGEEFDKKSKRQISDGKDLNLGISSQSKAGKKTIIDVDVFDKESNDVALSKAKFSEAIYNGEIEISDESWKNFRHIFEKIKSILDKNLN